MKYECSGHIIGHLVDDGGAGHDDGLEVLGSLVILVS